MKSLAVLLLIAAALVPASAEAAAAGQPFVVHLRDVPEGLAAGDDLMGRAVLSVDRVLGFAVLAGAPVRLSENVLGVEADVPVQLVSLQEPNDPSAPTQYALQQIRARQAWANATGGGEKTICVVDTGVRTTHEDLAGPRYLGGYDFVHGDEVPDDENGHGTHVAGTAAATSDNGRGVAGVAQSGFYAVKVLDGKGGGRSSNVASGVRWCADAGADIVSMSLGSGQPSQAMQEAIEYASGKGALVVAAAGNSGPCTNCVSYPAAFPEALAVTCTDAKEGVCSFSSTGPQAEIAAPGHQILSTWKDGDDAYKAISGTSMSTPHVTGVAALVWNAAPNLTADQVRTILTQTARDAGKEGHDEKYGHGIVDALAAVRMALGQPPPAAPAPAPQPEPAPTPEPAPQRPVAKAGPSQTVRDEDGDGRAAVTLNGSASGGAVRWEWHAANGTLLAEGEVATVELPVGRHTVTLTVTSAAGGTDTDRVGIRVEANAPPEAVASATCAGGICTLDGGRSRDPDGGAVTHLWFLPDGTVLEGAVVRVALPAGMHTVRLEVTDASGQTGRTAVYPVVAGEASSWTI